MATTADTDTLRSLAAEAYVYGYPLVADVMGALVITEAGYGIMKPAPFNKFAHATQLAGPEDRFVSVNNDTVYIIATVDLSGGPLVLHVPDTAGRYYVLQFVDAWSNNFAYVGRRATGTDEGEFVLAPAGWDGALPDEASRIDAPTRVLSIIGRIAVDGQEDLPTVAALQEQFTLRPLGEGGELAGVPRPDASLPEHLRFFDAMRLWSRAFPPPAAERDHLERFEPLGLLADDGVYSQVDASRFAGLGEGLAAGKAEIDELAQASPDGGGWTTTLHTTTSTTSGRGRSTPRNGRSAAARRRSSRARSPPGPGCGAITPTRRSTPSSTDENGDQLDGARRYEMHLSEPLPVDSFWSLTMYDVPDYFLVANPIDRYSIGDRTRGLVAEPDASLTIYIQHDEPDDESQRANWLPAPTGQFRPALRMYTPRQPLLDGSYTLPRIRRVG